MDWECWRRSARVPLVGSILAAALAACAVPGSVNEAGSVPLAAYVVIGPEGAALARAIVNAGPCPSLQVDGTFSEMALRVAPSIVPQRPTASAAADSKPSVFPVEVCEARLPRSAHRIEIAGQTLPAPAPEVKRLVVIGDTGCRIKLKDNAFQDCADVHAWPFAEVAEKAAQEHPDLVLHVGDYHYRETACPPGRTGCAGSPWGYGWDAWNADFFQPARPLLAAAPWVLVRGNHEECARAGQGWFRYLDPSPYEGLRSCDDPAHDELANFSDPYAVPLGGDRQLVVFDSAVAGVKLDGSAQALAALAHYRTEAAEVARLVQVPGMQTLFTSHHPVLGTYPSYGHGAQQGTPTLLGPLAQTFGTRYLPAGVDLALHGHVHLFQALDFSSGQPATLVAGNGGDNLDDDAALGLPDAVRLVPGVTLAAWWHAGRFGYLVMDRTATGWHVEAKSVAGTAIAQCEVVGNRISCGPKSTALAPPRTSSGRPLT